MKLPHSFRNWTSIIGASIALMNFVFIIFLLIISFVFDIGSSYIGLFIYMILPAFLITGLILIPVGMFLSKRKSKKRGDRVGTKDWPLIDFNSPGTRNASVIFVVGTMVLLIFSAVGSYEAFHITESVEFCGKLCHKVMEPEFVAYHESSHERVSCVECHVGNGADWYVKSKLSGLYQVYSVLAKKYPTPIPTPIHNLRPARQTCEQCHWPEKFYDRKLKIKRSYLSDEGNTEHNIQMLMKTSSDHNALGITEGIHRHINPDIKIEYIAVDAKRKKIPWVRYTNLKTGEVNIFEDTDQKLSQNEIDSLEVRTMDCLDCHNRPSHNYKVPQNIIDEFMIAGTISKDLPYIKIVSTELLDKDYPSTDSAFIAIDYEVKAYYKKHYPDLLQSKKQEIEDAIAGIQKGYSKNFFPKMGVKWSEYPNFLGHLETEGCYRCHNDTHSTTDGKVISRDCNLCHSIIAQGTSLSMEYSNFEEPLEFKHPVDIDEAWKEMLCTDCHEQLY